MARCFVIHPADNVATMLDNADNGALVEILGAGGGAMLTVGENMALGHKVAVMDIACGAPVIKYGVAIGTAGEHIFRGRWVHLHNCISQFDQRSGTLDVHTGAATDTRYE